MEKIFLERTGAVHETQSHRSALVAQGAFFFIFYYVLNEEVQHIYASANLFVGGPVGDKSGGSGGEAVPLATTSARQPAASSAAAIAPSAASSADPHRYNAVPLRETARDAGDVAVSSM